MKPRLRRRAASARAGRRRSCSARGSATSPTRSATRCRSPYSDMPHWPASKVIGHDGRLVVGTLARQRVAALSGRAHFYEGHDLQTVTFATRVIGRLGVKALILTNAAGGINTEPQAGHADGDGRSHQPARQQPADRAERRAVRRAVPGHERGVLEAAARHCRRGRARAGAADLATGSTSRVHGPSYETPAEIRFLRTIGADAVGMSTVPEAIVARHMGIEVLGISCITNMAAGVLPQPLNHDEVMEIARQVRGAVRRAARGHHWPRLTRTAGKAIGARYRERRTSDRRSGADRRSRRPRARRRRPPRGSGPSLGTAAVGKGPAQRGRLAAHPARRRGCGGGRRCGAGRGGR